MCIIVDASAFNVIKIKRREIVPLLHIGYYNSAEGLSMLRIHQHFPHWPVLCSTLPLDHLDPGGYIFHTTWRILHKQNINSYIHNLLVRKDVQISNPRYLDSKFARQEASMISQILLPQDSLLAGSYIFGRVILARIFCLKQKQYILHKFMNI